MAHANGNHTARHHTKHRWNIPDGWSDSDIFGYDTHETNEDDQTVLEIMEELFPARPGVKRGVIKTDTKK